LLLGVVLAIALGVGLFTSFGSSPTSGQLQVGELAPAFSLPKLTGAGRVGVPADGGGHGRPAVVLFFASWCAPCRAEIPALARIYRQQQASRSPLAKVALLGVDTADPEPNALNFVRSSGVTFPVAADAQYVVIDRYGFVGDPDAVFVEGNGTVAGIEEGPLSAASLVSWEHRLLGGG
jgi:thiol-disulfide isomerase/thioredoxin